MPNEPRVHGVSGTPPRDLLYCDSYDQGRTWPRSRSLTVTTETWRPSLGKPHLQVVSDRSVDTAGAIRDGQRRRLDERVAHRLVEDLGSGWPGYRSPGSSSLNSPTWDLTSGCAFFRAGSRGDAPSMRDEPEWDEPSEDFDVVGTRMWSIPSIVQGHPIDPRLWILIFGDRLPPLVGTGHRLVSCLRGERRATRHQRQRR